ncbi:MAG: hypothetical protein ABI873_17580, partial [Marmoricola sp.]
PVGTTSRISAPSPKGPDKRLARRRPRAPDGNVLRETTPAEHNHRMTAYDAGAWSIFALATAAASAALAGLLLVAASLNLDRILRHPRLPGRAAMALGVLTTVLVSSLFVLVPGQSRVVLGVEIAVLGLVLAVADVVGMSNAPPDGRGQRVPVPALVALLPAVALVVGGLSIEAEAGGGLYWVFAACLLGIVGAVQDGWAVLVEVNR